MNWAQWIIVGLIGFSFFRLLYWDINGRSAREPLGFQGVVGTIIATALVIWLYWCAGLFSAH